MNKQGIRDSNLDPYINYIFPLPTELRTREHESNSLPVEPLTQIISIATFILSYTLELNIQFSKYKF